MEKKSRGIIQKQKDDLYKKIVEQTKIVLSFRANPPFLDAELAYLSKLIKELADLEPIT